MDGRMSPVRIARILAELDPDVIALQELDVGRSRTGGIDQAQRLADLLEMDLQFHPSFNMREERYGNAVLTRLPMKRIAAGTLPTLNARCEPRGVLWVELELGENRIHLVTTHLGTSSRERAIQGDVLLGENWLSHPNISPHAILCGDLNAVPRSHVYRRIASRFQDVQTGSGKRPKATWFGPLPLRRIDHIFVTENFRVLQSLVPRTRRTQVSSDHLPLVTDLALLPLALPSKTHERPATAVR